MRDDGNPACGDDLDVVGGQGQPSEDLQASRPARPGSSLGSASEPTMRRQSPSLRRRRAGYGDRGMIVDVSAVCTCGPAELQAKGAWRTLRRRPRFIRAERRTCWPSTARSQNWRRPADGLPRWSNARRRREAPVRSSSRPPLRNGSGFTVTGQGVYHRGRCQPEGSTGTPCSPPRGSAGTHSNCRLRQSHFVRSKTLRAAKAVPPATTGSCSVKISGDSDGNPGRDRAN